MSEEQSSARDPLWCLVANVREFTRHGHRGVDIQRGLKHFSAGTKIYCRMVRWGLGYPRVTVVGRHRGSRRMVSMVVESRFLANWRVRLVYNPAVLNMLRGWSGCRSDEQACQDLEALKETIIQWEPDRPAAQPVTGMEPRLHHIAQIEPSLGHERRLEYLLLNLRDVDRKIRAKAVRLLGDLGDPDAVQALVEVMVTDPVEYIRMDCAIALDRIGTPEAIDASGQWRERRRNSGG